MVAVFTPAFDDREPEEKARELFYRAILPLRIELFRMALKLTNHREDAEDLLHDSFLKALNRISSLANEKNARAWMYSILKNTFISNCRMANRRQTFSSENLQMDKVHEIIEGHLNMVRKVELQRGIEKLDATFRQPLILCDYYGYSYSEAARRIGCPVGTLMSRLSRSRAKLKQILSA